MQLQQPGRSNGELPAENDRQEDPWLPGSSGHDNRLAPNPGTSITSPAPRGQKGERECVDFCQAERVQREAKSKRVKAGSASLPSASTCLLVGVGGGKICFHGTVSLPPSD